jgi:cyanobactin maturation PatA/PatG family protease
MGNCVETNVGLNVADIHGVSDVWAETKGDSRVCVAVLDSTVALHHGSLRESKLSQLNTDVDCGSRQPSSLHGTHVTSLIFGQGHDSIYGLAPKCRGLILSIFTEASDKSLTPCSQTNLARAILLASSEGAHIINVSGGQLSETGDAHPLLADAIRRCTEDGVLVVAAAGNDGCACVHIPGALPSVLAVGAMDDEGRPLEFSNWGERYQTKGVLAPGSAILGAHPQGGSVPLTGTSFATAIVSGVSALLLSLQLKHGHSLDTKLVREAILQSALGCETDGFEPCKRLLVGRLNIKGAASLIKNGGVAMSEKIAGLAVSEHAPPSNMEESRIGTPSSADEGEKFGASRPAATSLLSLTSQGQGGLGVNPSNMGMVPAGMCSCAKGQPCNCGATLRQKALVMGTLDIGFRSLAEHDSLAQHMRGNPQDLPALIKYLSANPWDASSILWLLKTEQTPLYAILPQGAFARDAYDRLREFLDEQNKLISERVAIAGWVIGSTPLMTGETVPFLVPELRCMYNWTTSKLIEAVSGPPPKESAKDREKYEQTTQTVRNFLERMYHELRGFGTDPRDRARIAATINAANVSNIFQDALKKNLQLDTIRAVPSPVGREGFEYYDVEMFFFDPENQFERAWKVYRFAVDVSQPCPVMVGPVRSWDVSHAAR